MTAEIPGPKGLPLIGNLLDLQDEVPLHAIERLIDIYGPIVKFNIAGRETVVVGGFELFDELCDETRFFKVVVGSLQQNRPPGPAGLFTAVSEKDEDWGLAHRILMPAFGPLAIEEMFDEMHDIASQLVLKWARQGSEHRIAVTSDFSRLTLDTIALCAMDYRFNSFYQDELHPFVQAMNNVLTERSNARQLSGMIKRMFPSHMEQLKKDVDYQKQVSHELVEYRREHPTEKKDLLNAMIYGKDPKSGKTMSDELIAANMQTFLIAGHETTSGLLSFAFLLMLKNPSTYFAAQQEIDRVVGKDRITAKHLKELKYINAVLRETLRLDPTAPAFARGPRPDNKEEIPAIGGGRYAVPPHDGILCLIGKIQRDPKVWGEDANEFKPERMLDSKFEKLPKNAWKPFGTGMRACIGRAFAWQEALLAIALILQNFELRLDDPNYEMQIVQSLTIKPKDFYMRASLRPGISATKLQQQLQAPAEEISRQSDTGTGDNTASNASIPITILYGSNTGTCQALAQKLGSHAAQRGFAVEIKDMDDATDRLPKDRPVVLITASYEGLPPDNAARFVAWLESVGGNSKPLDGVQYAVFGCGHRDWVSTFQRIPKLVDELISKYGGQQFTERGESDASKGDMFGDFEGWLSKKLWPALSSYSGGAEGSELDSATSMVDMTISTEERASHLQQNVRWATIVDTKALTAASDGAKRHIELQLPSNMTYTSGDYLAVLPLNPDENVRRVVKKFDLPWDGIVTISKSGSTTLPINEPIKIFDLLRGYVELSQPATRQDLQTLIANTRDGTDKIQLQTLVETSAFENQVLAKRLTVLDVLDSYPSIALPFGAFLSLLPPLRPRHYSISSSPLANPGSCTLTYSVIDAPSWSSGQRFIGVTGSYLRSLTPGDQALVSVRSTNKFFRLPPDPEKTPILMVCAGSGIAPFRGFVQERAILIKEGKRELAPALMFLGCRSPDTDRLYAEEIDEWVKLGAVDIRYAFSKVPERSEGCRYVQDRIRKDKEDWWRMWEQGAKFYICGGADLANGVGKVARQLTAEHARREGRDMTDEEIEEFVQKMRNERFVADIF